MIGWIAICGVVCFILGYVVAVLLVSRDQDLIRLKQDEVIVQRPAVGLVLISVPPHVMRRLIMQPGESSGHEARTLYPREGSKQK